MIISDAIGDGSSREQAASSQKVLGGYADLAHTYATKRYRSNLINWGILPLQTEEAFSLQPGDLLFIKDVQEQILSENGNVEVQILRGGASENREGSAAELPLCGWGVFLYAFHPLRNRQQVRCLWC